MKPETNNNNNNNESTQSNEPVNSNEVNPPLKHQIIFTSFSKASRNSLALSNALPDQ